MSRKAGPNEESRARSRARFLQAGAALVANPSLQKPFAALRLRRLCECAGLSPGAFYEHWPTTEAYREDLASYLAEEDKRQASAGHIFLLYLAGKGTEQDALTAIAHLAERDLQLLVSNPFRNVTGLAAATQGQAHLQDQLRQAYEDTDRSTGLIYRSALAKQGREPRPPLDWDEIGAILQGLAKGLSLRHKTDPTAVPAAAESAIKLYTTAATALLAVLTRPADDQATAHDAIRSLLTSDPQTPEGKRDVLKPTAKPDPGYSP
jgi:AcrR family transcriptional regulator